MSNKRKLKAAVGGFVSQRLRKKMRSDRQALYEKRAALVNKKVHEVILEIGAKLEAEGDKLTPTELLDIKGLSIDIPVPAASLIEWLLFYTKVPVRGFVRHVFKLEAEKSMCGRAHRANRTVRGSEVNLNVRDCINCGKAVSKMEREAIGEVANLKG